MASTGSGPPPSAADLAELERQLGREPRGVAAVVRRCRSGHPLVVQSHPLPQGERGLEPFPTLYWLTCPVLHRRIARLERLGGVSRLIDALREDPVMQSRHAADRRWYARRRFRMLTPEQRALCARRGWLPVLRDSGVGGVRSAAGVKCLHLQAAYHLVRATAAGAWLAARVDLSPCGEERTTPVGGGSEFAPRGGSDTLVG